MILTLSPGYEGVPRPTPFFRGAAPIRLRGRTMFSPFIPFLNHRGWYWADVKDSEMFLRALRRVKPVNLFTTPTLAVNLVGAAVPRLRRIFLGWEVVPPSLIEDLRSAGYQAAEFYGTCETGLAAVGCPLTPLSGVDMRTVRGRLVVNGTTTSDLGRAVRGGFRVLGRASEGDVRSAAESAYRAGARLLYIQKTGEYISDRRLPGMDVRVVAGHELPAWRCRSRWVLPSREPMLSAFYHDLRVQGGMHSLPPGLLQ